MSIEIRQEQCIACGQCAKICPVAIKMINNKAVFGEDEGFGCVGCGQCAMICPVNCVTVKSKLVDTDSDLFVLPAKNGSASYHSLHALMQRRRSVREYSGREVEPEKIEMIIESAKTSPIAAATTSSDVNVLVLGKAKTREFAFDCISILEKFNILWSDKLWSIIRFVFGKKIEKTDLGFFRYLVRFAIDNKNNYDKDFALYGAPLSFLFYVRKGGQKVNIPIACTHAMLAAESLGLKTCMIESVAPIVMSSKKIREKYGIEHDVKSVLILICGYADVEFKRGVKRKFLSAKTWISQAT